MNANNFMVKINLAINLVNAKEFVNVMLLAEPRCY